MGSAADVIKQNPNVDSIVVGWDMQLTALKVATWLQNKSSGNGGIETLLLRLLVCQ